MTLKRPCWRCGTYFSPEGKFVRFCLECRERVFSKYKCEWCAEDFRYKQTFVDHLRRYHRIKAERNSIKPIEHKEQVSSFKTKAKDI